MFDALKAALTQRFAEHVAGGRLGEDAATAIAHALVDVGIVPGQAPAAGDAGATAAPIAALEKLIEGAKQELAGKLADVFNEFSAHQVGAVDALRAEIERVKAWVHVPAAQPDPQPADAAPAAPEAPKAGEG